MPSISNISTESDHNSALILNDSAAYAVLVTAIYRQTISRTYSTLNLYFPETKVFLNFALIVTIKYFFLSRV